MENTSDYVPKRSPFKRPRTSEYDTRLQQSALLRDWIIEVGPGLQNGSDEDRETLQRFIKSLAKYNDRTAELQPFARSETPTADGSNLLKRP